MRSLSHKTIQLFTAPKKIKDDDYLGPIHVDGRSDLHQYHTQPLMNLALRVQNAESLIQTTTKTIKKNIPKVYMLFVIIHTAYHKCMLFVSYQYTIHTSKNSLGSISPFPSKSMRSSVCSISVSLLPSGKCSFNNAQPVKNSSRDIT